MSRRGAAIADRRRVASTPPPQGGCRSEPRPSAIDGFVADTLGRADEWREPFPFGVAPLPSAQTAPGSTDRGCRWITPSPDDSRISAPLLEAHVARRPRPEERFLLPVIADPRPQETTHGIRFPLPSPPLIPFREAEPDDDANEPVDDMSNCDNQVTEAHSLGSTPPTSGPGGPEDSRNLDRRIRHPDDPRLSTTSGRGMCPLAG
jgi:hypothetical protein